MSSRDTRVGLWWDWPNGFPNPPALCYASWRGQTWGPFESGDDAFRFFQVMMKLNGEWPL